MKVLREGSKTVMLFVPDDDEEEYAIVSVGALFNEGDKLVYCGEGGDRFSIRFNAGGRKEQKTIRRGSMNVVVDDYVGGHDLYVTGTDETGRAGVEEIRSICHCGSGGLIYLATILTANGRFALLTTGVRCRRCGRSIAKASRAVWKICLGCAWKCDHQYFAGKGGEYCERCGLEKSEMPAGQTRQSTCHNGCGGGSCHGNGNGRGGGCPGGGDCHGGNCNGGGNGRCQQGAGCHGSGDCQETN